MNRHETDRGQRGSALVTSLFVLALLTTMGVSLLFLASSDVRMNQASLRAKRVFYTAEGALEESRNLLRVENLASVDPSELSDELTRAAGANGVMDFDVDDLRPVRDSGGKVIGFTGYGDDVPLKAFTPFDDGTYATFLTNDPLDGLTNLTDSNDRVTITSVGTGPSRSLEIVQAVVERVALPPFPAGITLLGPLPTFKGGESMAKRYVGDDCRFVPGATGVPGFSVPTVGTIGVAAELAAETGVKKPDTYQAGGETGVDTVDDVSGVIDPLWNDCAFLVELAGLVKSRADYVCPDVPSCSHWSTSTLDTVTYVEGDAIFDPVESGKGLLFVEGRVEFQGNHEWEGIVLAIGQGEIIRTGGGDGHQYGVTLVANISGPDGVLGTADDCSTGFGGIDSGSFEAPGHGNHDVIYCSDIINRTNFSLPLKIVDFRQR